MKKTLSLLLLFIIPLFAHASIYIDGFSYDIMYSSREAAVSISNYSDANDAPIDIVIPSSIIYKDIEFSVTRIASVYIPKQIISSIVIPSSVIEIEAYAFSGCAGLITIDIPNNVTKIGEYAFNNCTNLTSIKLSNNINTIEAATFSGCTGLTSIVIPNSVTMIGEYAFKGCTGLSSIVIPNGVTEIGQQAFYDCSSLSKIDLPDSVVIVDFWAFNNTPWYNNQPEGVVYAGKVAYDYKGTMPEGTEIKIKQGTTGITSCAFSSCYGLISIVIPNSVKVIGESAFQECTGLSSIEIPNSVIEIRYWAFKDCSSLSKIDIPDSVVSIGEDAFNGTSWYNNQPDGVVYAGKVAYKYKGVMPNGSTIVIKDGTKAISDEAFEDCIGLSSIKFPGSLTKIGEGAFWGCTSLTSAVIPEGVLEIGWGAFWDCTSLASVEIPNSVTSIESCAFLNCSGLTSIEIPNRLTVIEDEVFYGCSGLTSIEIPNNVVLIGYGAFQNCLNLKEVTVHRTYLGPWFLYAGFGESVREVILGDEVEEISEDAFSGCVGIEHVICGKNLSYIGAYAFEDCTSLTTIDIRGEIKEIEEGTFESCTSLASFEVSSLDSIGRYAFFDCSSLASFKVSSLLSIKEYSFYGCTSLSSFDLPNNLRKIEQMAFAECTSLTAIDIPDSVSEIEWGVFGDCSSLTSIRLPNSINRIEEETFYGCTSLTSIIIPDCVTEIERGAFWGCTSLSSIEVPSSVTIIGANAFSETLWFENKPDGVVYVGKVAYKYKGMMPESSEIVLDQGTISISGYAFSECTNLVSIGLPNSVTAIGYGAFEGCYNLGAVISEIVDVFDIDYWVFDYDTYWKAILYIPEGTLDLYQQAEGWRNFTNIEFISYVKSELTEDLYTLYLPDEDITYDGMSHGARIETRPGVGKASFYYLKNGESSMETDSPSEVGDYSIYLEIEEGSIYYGLERSLVGTFSIYQFSSEEWTLLQDIYSQLTTMSWTNPWDMAQGINSVSSLHGLTIMKGHISGIDLSRQNLTGSFPASIFTLPHLMAVNLSDNNLAGDLSDITDDLTNQNYASCACLEEIDLSGNHLSGNIGPFANCFKNLNTLDVSFNYFEEVYPMIPETVTSLDLRNQTISRVVPLHLSNISADTITGTFPSLLLYNHANRKYDPNMTLRVTTSYDDWGMTVYLQNERLSFSNVYSQNVYHGNSGDIINAIVPYNTWCRGTTFPISLKFDDGDANFDGNVNVLDLQSSLNYMFRRYSDYQPYNFTASDLWEDENINVQDAVCLVNVLLDMDSYSGQLTSQTRRSKAFMTDDCAVVSFEDGYLTISSSVPVSSFDIVISTDQICELLPSLSVMGLTCSIKQSSGKLHIVGYSLEGVALPAGRNSICRLDDGLITYAMLSDQEAQEIDVSYDSAITDIRSSSYKNRSSEVYRFSVGPNRVIVVDSERNKSMIKDK